MYDWLLFHTADEGSFMQEIGSASAHEAAVISITGKSSGPQKRAKRCHWRLL